MYAGCTSQFVNGSGIIFICLVKSRVLTCMILVEPNWDVWVLTALYPVWEYILA